jgi:hypothetical protein
MYLSRGAGLLFSGASARRIGNPSNTHRVQTDLVTDAEAFGIQDSLIGVPYDFVLGDAPGFVANDALAVLTGAV